MKVVSELRSLEREPRVASLAIGVFDGLHRGHQAVIAAAVGAAGGDDAWILSFDAHPESVLEPGASPPMIMSTAHRLQVMGRLGIAGCVLIHFTREFAAREPESFVADLCVAAPHLRGIFVGENWRFGRGGRGDVALLARMMGERGIGVNVVAPVFWSGAMISSTRIRREIAEGRLDSAAAMLGRPFSIAGRVVHGRRIGRTLGYPTANIRPENEVHPPHGVYAVLARLPQGLCEGVLNIGLRPTFGDRQGRPSIELHLLDFSGDLYGRDVEVFFIALLRAEQRFASPQALAEQIARDASEARRALADAEEKNSWKNALQASAGCV